VDACTDCGVVQISYNSCRNRHCPKCQGHKREQWIAEREAELLPVPYYHVVFTLPSALNTLAMYKPKLVYDTLFKSAWHTLSKFGHEQHVELGMVSVLHTWGQALTLHPHFTP
jgi:Transposase zinc-binding domain/Putative transposase